MNRLSDRALWRRAVAGEAEAFGEIYERHANAIYNFCFRRCADWALAEDLTATVFLEAWRKRRRVVFDGEDAVLPWLYGVAGNVLRNNARRHRRFVRFLGSLGAPPSFPDSAERLAEEEEMRRILERAVTFPATPRYLAPRHGRPSAGSRRRGPRHGVRPPDAALRARRRPVYALARRAAHVAATPSERVPGSDPGTWRFGTVRPTSPPAPLAHGATSGTRARGDLRSGSETRRRARAGPGAPPTPTRRRSPASTRGRA